LTDRPLPYPSRVERQRTADGGSNTGEWKDARRRWGAIRRRGHPTTIGAGGEVVERARSSTERHGEPVGGHDEHIELNPASTSSDHADLHSNHGASTPNTDRTLSTVQRTSGRGKDTGSAIEGNAPAEGSASADRTPPNRQPISTRDTTQVLRET